VPAPSDAVTFQLTMLDVPAAMVPTDCGTDGLIVQPSGPPSETCASLMAPGRAPPTVSDSLTFQPRQDGVCDLAPAVVDGQRVAAVGELGEFGRRLGMPVLLVG